MTRVPEGGHGKSYDQVTEVKNLRETTNKPSYHIVVYGPKNPAADGLISPVSTHTKSGTAWRRKQK